MGNFYGNITLQTADTDAVVKTLGDLGRDAYVAPASEYTVVYDEHELSEKETRKILAALTERLSCAGLAVAVVDDDVLGYLLGDRGKVVDEYDSNPGLRDTGMDPPSGGDVARLCAAFGLAGKEDEVRAILQNTDVALEVHRHEALVEALGFPGAAVGMGFTYLAQGEAEDAGITELITVGNAPDPYG